ncbi:MULTISPECIES: hypothetical protein [Sphingomonas]|jgi:hypothetical protein|uniref:Uncharacterized protein n=1 Tax=Sphingomonas zeae TaxID=1646122 RepID=A0A7Y6B3M0_9SPHN|nr:MULTISPECIES: hypothetical protein [Sphingomonas]MBB4048422.1 hypothetical protein [Sphingomonas zeae]MDK8187235.1 hypothetical protein [Sphingomonas zeae]MDK8216977.1 hypothetical protein [Sphingomonas sp. UMB7805-LC452B]NUU46825.1 hypothetical protein [Sphingomonas zeae]
MTRPRNPGSACHGVHDEAGVATAECGIVMLDGPNGVAVAMTPAAARATGEGLVAAAHRAEVQGGVD